MAEDELVDVGLPEVGYTGARFGGGGRKRRKAAVAAEAAVAAVAAEAAEEPQAPAPELDEGPVVGMTGARFGGSARHRPHEEVAEPVPQPAMTVAPPAVVEWPLHLREAEPGPGPEAPVSIRVRPYVFTGGRTRAHIDLELETLVSVGPYPAHEHHAVVELCRTPVSVAEVAALMGVPLGVARVLVGDLAAQGALIVHATGVQDVPGIAFLERVLTGLRRL